MRQRHVVDSLARRDALSRDLIQRGALDTSYQSAHYSERGALLNLSGITLVLLLWLAAAAVPLGLVVLTIVWGAKRTRARTVTGRS